MEHETVMIACAHGTNNAEGQRRINALRADIALLRPGLTVLEAYVDVQEPALPDVVAGLAARARRGGSAAVDGGLPRSGGHC
ncbi:hypothetical protein NHF46_19520 [Arthrobacter alpinus]|nr:hypothetical protein [Arthrobacter alpinus]